MCNEKPRKSVDPIADIQESYDRVAREYADKLYTELENKPFDRELLNRFARQAGKGWVCDLGCGPAQIARYLCDGGLKTFGVDLSAGMLAQAKRLNPEIHFVQSSMLALGLGSATLAGIAAFYSIIHIPRARVTEALQEMARVLRPGGCLLITFHLGGEDTHHEELFGQAVQLDVALFTNAEMCGYLQAAGFRVEEALERDPYAPEIEYQSRRGYLLAAKPRE
jgi:SAM-dependent methyltransferase